MSFSFSEILVLKIIFAKKLFYVSANISNIASWLSNDKYFKNIILINLHVPFLSQKSFGLVSYSTQASVTKYHRQGDFNHRCIFSQFQSLEI